MAQSAFNDAARLDGKCPTCGRTYRFTLGDARRSRTVRCPGGHDIHLDGKDFDRQLRDLEKGFRGLK